MDNDANDHNAKAQPRERASCGATASLLRPAGTLATAGPVDEAIIAALERSGDFRILRRIRPPRPVGDRDAHAAVALVVDVETTGLDPDRDEVIELAMARVRYDIRTGDLLGIEGCFSALREPSVPIPEDVRRLTGLGQQDVLGRSIEPGDVAAFAEGARLVIAHNAAFDRRFAEAAWPDVFAPLPWACSCALDWSVYGFEGAKLGYLVTQSGAFHDGHRALDDVLATLHLLALDAPPGPPFRSLLEMARAPTARVWADGAAFAAKGVLKSRGYRWSNGGRRTPRGWYIDLPETGASDEVAFLRERILDDPAREPPVVRITAFDRFTDRAGRPAQEL